MHTPSLRWLTGLALGAALSAALLAPAAAHGPTRQKVTETIAIDAPADKVWALVKDFSALKNWHPAVAESPADKGNDEGSVRQIKLKNGGALPVTNYTSTITVKAEGAGSVVEWRGAFYRGYPNNDPPPDQNDEAAVAAVTGVYKAGLANLKAMAEKK